MEAKKTTLISLRLDPEIARAFKVEAARRDLKLNYLFEDIFRNHNAAPVDKKRVRSDG